MTDWQHHYETGNTPWNSGGAAPALVQWMERHSMHGPVLAPGCGHGHDLVALADSGAAGVVGLDIAPGGVAAARERTAGLSNVRVELGNLFEWTHGAGRGQFDWVIEHTCFCAIPREMRESYVSAIADALKPGGTMLALFYLKPWDEGEDQMQGPPFGCSTEELDERFGPSFELLDSTVPDVSYSGREGKELLRTLRRR